MMKKTRIRVARIAAGAVVAAGASLMVTGVAQADDENPICDIVVTPECEEPGGGNTEEPGGGNTEEPGGGNTEEPGGGNTEEPGGG
ncbi:hypothetical protein ACH4M3_30080, partial [Streptomyces sp. NPDC017260]